MGEDTKPHIRTYARDVARLTNKPLEERVHMASVMPEAPIAPTKKAEGATAPAAPTPKPKIESPLPPPPIPPAPPITPQKPESVSIPIPPSPTVLPEPVPGIPNLIKQIPPVTPATDRSPVHTYKSDFAEFSNAKGASQFSILASQMDAKRTVPAVLTVPPTSHRSLYMIIGAAVLIVVGVGGVFAAYEYSLQRAKVVVEPPITSLISADARAKLSGSATDLRQGVAGAQGGQNLRDREVLIDYITYSTTTQNGLTEVPASGGALIEALALPAPSILLRNVESDSVVGSVRIQNETRPFFILRVSSYDRTFAGMLSWEPTMERDLALFYPDYPSTATTTASTTPATLARLSFTDAVVQNHDVRVLRNLEGKTIMLYGYRDPETLIIARNENAFGELVTRLEVHSAR